jgi:trans-2,3-dihydro-3-hydroxyanthranilate isomerase
MPCCGEHSLDHEENAETGKSQAIGKRPERTLVCFSLRIKWLCVAYHEAIARWISKAAFMSRRYRTVDVFTRTMFGGNPLAVVLDADGLDDSQMQAIAKEFNYSETSFVRQPLNSRHTAEVRIFTPSTEVPFAGHPNVGTAYVLASLDDTPAHTSEFVFEEKAGLVRVALIRVAGVVRGAQLTAPQPLTIGSVFDHSAVAACLGVSDADVEIKRHRPLIASVGLPFSSG